MKILKKTILEDNKIGDQIKEIGVTKVAKEIGIARTYLQALIAEQEIMSFDKYSMLKEVIKGYKKQKEEKVIKKNVK